MKIGIIGNGFVGKATKVLECEGISITCYDIDPKLCVPEETHFSQKVHFWSGCWGSEHIVGQDFAPQGGLDTTTGNDLLA